jgi:hypothetical protein
VKLISKYPRIRLHIPKKIDLIMIISFGLVANWMEWRSFGNVDCSEMIWLGISLVLGIILHTTNHFRTTSVTTIHWLVLGGLFWYVWRFIYWIFASRGGAVFSILSFLTAPLGNLMKTNPEERLIGLFAILVCGLGVWAMVWIVINWNNQFVRKAKIYWIVLVLIVLTLSIYTHQPAFELNSFGVSSYSNGFYFLISDQIGVIGSTVIAIVFFLWCFTLAFRNGGDSENSPILIIAAMTPVWIEIFFNPTRILSVPMLNAIRSNADSSSLVESLEIFMRILNHVPIVVFFTIIPFIMLSTKSKKIQNASVGIISGITLLGMLGLLFYSLELSKSVFRYELVDYLIFSLMALQIWLPTLIAIIVSSKIDRSFLTPEETEFA